VKKVLEILAFLVINLPDIVGTINRYICNNDHTLELASRLLSPLHQLDNMLENTPRVVKDIRAPVVERGGKRRSEGSKGHLEVEWS
jgi:hypothetical protein